MNLNSKPVIKYVWEEKKVPMSEKTLKSPSCCILFLSLFHCQLNFDDRTVTERSGLDCDSILKYWTAIINNLRTLYAKFPTREIDVAIHVRDSKLC